MCGIIYYKSAFWYTGRCNYKIFFKGNNCILYCPGKEAALGSIVVSLTCTTYLWGSLIAL